MTLGDRLRKFEGVGPGFDHLRIGLSIAILIWHCFPLAYGRPWTLAMPTLPFQPLLAGMLPMFFGLSGFLVMGSALRTHNVQTFIIFRAFRIVPALFTEISLSALVLGPLLTVVPLTAYFESHEFFEYFGSLIGRVRYVLPGVYVTNPNPNLINGALWTVGPEILCYVTIAFAMLSGIYRRGLWMLSLAALYLVICIATDPWDELTVREILPTKTLVLSFLCGNILFLYRDKIPYSGFLSCVIFLASTMLVYLAQIDTSYHAAVYPAAAGYAYLVAFVGLTKLPEMPLLHRGDYSYGVYIYGFPIQQAVVYFFPEHREWWFVLLLSLPTSILIAAFSWHCVERPALTLRKSPILKRFETPESFSVVSLWAFATLLLLYGIFVADASEVFPLRQIGHSLINAARS